MTTNPNQNRNPTTNGQETVEIAKFEDTLKQNYIDYAMSVIAGRSLPDVRDGLKPVHRRILYAIDELNLTHTKSHRKSSSVVGETMGNYHPHGDKAIYDSLVRMAQEFSLRYPLIDGQGNFGSIDGDPPAAMRYTEARMNTIAEELLQDIDKDTVDFKPNYDDRLTEPGVLPAGFPNLLVNGASGIAVGMSTEIPPHNLGEVIEGTIHLINNPDATVGDLMDHIPAPDFPTAANIVQSDGIYEAYSTGRGKIQLEAEYHINELDSNRRGDQIIITELPYKQNKSKLIQRIADDVNEDKIDGISEIRDESDRDNIRVVINTKKGTNTDVIENKLLSNHLQKTIGIIQLALVDGQPQILSLKEILQEYINHRREVVKRRCEHELQNKEQRKHLLEGRLYALNNIDDIISLIRDTGQRQDAIERLTEEHDLSEDQSTHIVQMQLGSLTSLEEQDIEDEYESITTRIQELKTILSDQDKLDQIIIDELNDIKSKYDDNRQSSLIEGTGNVTHEDLIPEQQSLIVQTESGYIKRMPRNVLSPQQRAGKGVIGTDLKKGDAVRDIITASTHDTLLCFSSHGQVYKTKGYTIPEYNRTARGTSEVNVFKLDDDEHIQTILPVSEINEDQSVTLVTKEARIKRLSCSHFKNVRSTGIKAISLVEGDELADAVLSDPTDSLLVSTTEGRTIRFAATDVRETGRTAKGISAIQLPEDHSVTSVLSTSEDIEMVTITERGFGKRSSITEFRQQARNGMGAIDIKTVDRNGKQVDTALAPDGAELVMTTTQGQIMWTKTDEISTVSRNTKGATVMTTEDDDTVASVSTSIEEPSTQEEEQSDSEEQAENHTPQTASQ